MTLTSKDLKDKTLPFSQLTFATFNLFNFLEPPGAFYHFENIYTAEQWQKKQQWITNYLTLHQPDVIGFQEVFSTDAFKRLLKLNGYLYMQIIGQPDVIDDFIYRSPVVAIASKFPIIEAIAIEAQPELVELMALPSTFTFSRKVLRATIDLPHIGNTDCYVCHFKSKRSIVEENLTQEQSLVEQLSEQVIGRWGASIQRGSEAALLFCQMLARREQSKNPMILMGDFNNNLTDGILSHLLTNKLIFNPSAFEQDLVNFYSLQDAWQMHLSWLKHQYDDPENVPVRPATHYWGNHASVLDYILLSCEFDASFDDSFFAVTEFHTYDRHLINPVFAQDSQSTDHAVISITLQLRN